MPVYALIDCNTFFVSCERILNPKLHGKPVIVLSNNDGLVIARSQEAKALGITWDPFFKIKNLIERHGIHYFSSNYAFYGETSGRVMETLRQFSPRMEHYSIDEAFLDLSGFSNLSEYGRLIRETVLRWTEIPVSIGIAETKTLAKVANRLAKKSEKANGVLNLTKSPYQELALSRTPIKEVWGIGWAWAEKLERQGIRTALDFRNADEKRILRDYNIVLARTQMELRGIACLPLLESPPMSKSIMSSLSFGRPVEELRELRQAAATYAAKAAEKMRAEKLAASAVSVFLETNRYQPQEPQYYNRLCLPLPAPTEFTSEIIARAESGIEAIFRDGYRYRKVGVRLEGLVPSDTLQQGLFSRYPHERIHPLMKALDEVNGLYGPGTLRYGAEGFDKPWKMRQNHLSQPIVPGRGSEFQNARPVCELGTSASLVRSMV